MIFKPAQLGLARLDAHELEEDKKACRKIGPCGVGKKALYLNSFYIDRRYYLPYGSITRVFKRVAMSSGGFTGKGMFASMAYLVVEYDGGKQKQCNFKDERDVDKLLEVLAKEQPQIHLLSAAGEQMLQKKEAEKASRKLPESELTDDARHSITVLRRAKEYLEAKPEIADELSANDITAAARNISVETSHRKKKEKLDEVDLAQMSLFDTVKDDDILDELKNVDLGNMTPIDALNKLYELQNKIKNRW